MKFVAIYLITLLLFLLTFQKANAYDKSLLEYYGVDHSESTFNIIGYVVTDQSKEPTKAQIDSLIRKQMRYTLGLMRSREKQAAALYPKWTFSVLEIKKSAKGGSYSVKYNLKSKGVFAAGTTQYIFTIPYNPAKIFAQAQGKCRNEETVESNFWYHWEPLMRDCPLQENEHYFNYTAKIAPENNTTLTYPEYDKLIDTDKTIKITMFFGFANYGHVKWTPDDNNDLGIQGYNQQRNFLKNMGFSETIWNPQQVAAVYKTKDTLIPYIIEYQLPGVTANVRIRLILCDTGFYHKSAAFHALLKEAVAHESVVFYNGHSGIGHNLDLAAIEKLRDFKLTFNPKYQIIFLGSCVPYSYFTDMLFNKKRTAADPNGTLNLDILSYGKESFFGSREDQALTRALVLYAQRSAKKSYQDIIRSSPHYFFGVNGDEDNPVTQ